SRQVAPKRQRTWTSDRTGDHRGKGQDFIERRLSFGDVVPREPERPQNDCLLESPFRICQPQAGTDAWPHHARADNRDFTHVASAITLEWIIDLAGQLERSLHHANAAGIHAAYLH